MENASKALLIAGAVLLVIAIIAIGMGIFGTARGVVNQAEGQIDNMSIQMHNKQFEQYQKDILTGEEVKELVSTIMANNGNYPITDSSSSFGVSMELINNDSSGISFSSFDSYSYGAGGISSDITITYGNRYTCSISYNSNGIINYFHLNEV